MSIDELNELVRNGGINEFIRVCEARQRKKLSMIADAIVECGNIRLVLLAGASSAGKTTTAKRLCTQIRVNERTALHLSTDDYFVGDALNPRDENGELDYEHVECVDMPRLAQDINELIAGRTIRPRRFDFLKHDGYDADIELHLPEDGVIVLEGIHALNPRLTENIADECKYRMFIEPKSQIEVFGSTRLKSADARFLRRLVRDNQFRKLGPLETYNMWPKVLAGEEKWINPFRANADVEFDSGLEYELCVLKAYVAGLVEMIHHKVTDDARIATFGEMLSLIELASPNAVPGDSILRETIGGSQLEY